MLIRCKNRNRAPGARLAGSLFEALEPRRLLSSTASAIHTDSIIHRSDTSSANIQGYTPAQIRKAYQFDQISFSSGAVSGNGQGQTIAIVDAYNDPNIRADLNTFDSSFGLSAPPSLKIVNQDGGSTLPSTNAGWASEISLDVEWAHAIAPEANILLVEANSDVENPNTYAPDDLLAAVKYAARAPGVSVVSMSWGGSEFFSYNGVEFTSEKNYDSVFTTPAGHQPVTFIAAAGDSGAQGGVQWPAVSPNVLSVGGTSLYTASDGTYSTEASWDGTSGGYSQVESKPSYQNSAQNSSARSTPDVSYNGDPNTGFAVYDSLPYQGYSGWSQVGGTSAGSPQWAALIAIANQGRALSGKPALDGVSQTLPLLYSLYSAPGTAGYSSYANSFYDVQSGSGAPWQWGFGGLGTGSSATAGYDTATGLGSPNAAGLMSVLIGSSSTSSPITSAPVPSPTGTTIGSTPTSTPTATSPTGTSQLAASPLNAVFLTQPVGTLIGGENDSLKLLLTNAGGIRFDGPVSITLSASNDSTLSSDDTTVTTLDLPHVKINPGFSKTVKIRFQNPTGLADGGYYLIATVNTPDTNTAPATAITPSPVTINAPSVDLSTLLNDGNAISVTPGQDGIATVTIQNLGNVMANGTLSLTLYASADGAVDSSSVALATTADRKIRLRPGKATKLRIHFVAPSDAAAGTYDLVAALSSSTSPADANTTNDTAAVGTAG